GLMDPLMDPAAVHPVHDLLRRVQKEFVDMPGLRLTEHQARRLWNLDPLDCSAVLNALTDAQFLFRTREGSFMRVEHSTPLEVEPPTRAVKRPRITLV